MHTWRGWRCQCTWRGWRCQCTWKGGGVSAPGEQLKYKTANDADEASLDVVAENFWPKNRQKAFFDVKVFNPFSRSYVNTPFARRLEQDKRRSYEHRVREVEHGCFSPLVFSTLGGLSPTATIVYKRIVSLIAEKMTNLTVVPCSGSVAH